MVKEEKVVNPTVDQELAKAVALELFNLQKKAEQAAKPKVFKMTFDSTGPCMTYLSTTKVTYSSFMKGSKLQFEVFAEKGTGKVHVALTNLPVGGVMTLEEWTEYCEVIKRINDYIKTLDLTALVNLLDP